MVQLRQFYNTQNVSIGYSREPNVWQAGKQAKKRDKHKEKATQNPKHIHTRCRLCQMYPVTESDHSQVSGNSTRTLEGSFGKGSLEPGGLPAYAISGDAADNATLRRQ